MPLWRHGGVLSVQIESEIKALAQEKEKNTTHNLTDIRVCRFSHDHIQARAFGKTFTFDTKK